METGRAAAAATPQDQARLGWFRASLIVQLGAAGFFGIVPYVAPAEFARAFNLAGDEPYMIRLAAAATVGYTVPALLGLLRGSWTSLRVPIWATFVFNATAAAVSLVTIDETGLAPLPVIVAASAGPFAVVAAFWLWRSEGPPPAGEGLEPGFRFSLAGGTIAATAIGLWQLLLPRAFVSFWGLAGGDLVIVRLAGAATLGFGLAGLISFVVDRWPAARIQTVAAISANVAAAIASAIYIAQGGTSWLGWFFLLASGFLVLSLTAWAARAER